MPNHSATAAEALQVALDAFSAALGGVDVQIAVSSRKADTWTEVVTITNSTPAVAPRSLTALLDTSHRPANNPEWNVDVEQVEIPIAADPAACEHGETICPGCADSWACDYVFLEPFPWS